MEILELNFLYEGAEDRFWIGFFTSMDTVQQAVQKLRKAPGFCENPKGFYVVPRVVQTQRSDLTKIYVAFVHFMPREYHGGNYTESYTWLGFFAEKETADRAVRRYLDLNPEEIPGLERYCIASEYQLDKISAWEEGFTTDFYLES